MFKKVLQSLTRSLGKHTEPAKPAAKKAELAAPAAKAAAPAPAPKEAAKEESPLKKIAAVPVTPEPAKQTAEEICGIEPKMNKDQIKERLKLLYRRHNRAASSLDAKTRTEADSILDAIVRVREKTFGEI